LSLFLKKPEKAICVTPSAGGVPAFRKRNKPPRHVVVVVVGGLRRLVKGGGVGQNVLLCGRDGSSRSPKVRERTVSKVFCFRIEVIAQILSIGLSWPLWLLFPSASRED
jgi:hypothetical protein